MKFSFKNFVVIFFVIGFYKIVEDLYNTIKIKRIIKEFIDHLIKLNNKIKTRDSDIGEHLFFFNKHCKILNKTELCHLHCDVAPNQSLLNYILLNFNNYIKSCMGEDLRELLQALIFQSIQINEDINIWKKLVNFINPIVYLKKSTHCILENFYSLFPFSIPNFFKVILELISTIMTILISLKTLSPKTLDYIMSSFFSLFNGG